jgi:hypothetical protein
MKNVEILKQVIHKGEWLKPLPKGGPVVSVADYTADHWIATGAAKAAAETPKGADEKAHDGAKKKG